MGDSNRKSSQHSMYACSAKHSTLTKIAKQRQIKNKSGQYPRETQKPLDHFDITFIYLSTYRHAIGMSLIQCYCESKKREKKKVERHSKCTDEVLFLLCFSLFSLPLLNSSVNRYLLPCRILKTKKQQLINGQLDTIVQINFLMLSKDMKSR